VLVVVVVIAVRFTEVGAVEVGIGVDVIACLLTPLDELLAACVLATELLLTMTPAETIAPSGPINVVELGVLVSSLNCCPTNIV